MSKLINISINLSKVDKSKLVNGQKGVYLPLTINVKDEIDEYDNNVSAWQSQSEEERKAKAERNWLGNGRVIWSDDAAPKTDLGFMDGQNGTSQQAASTDQPSAKPLPF